MWPFKKLEIRLFQKHKLKISASMNESSGSLSFRTTSGIRSEPDTFDQLSFVINILTILGVTEILCSFRLLLEKETGIYLF